MTLLWYTVILVLVKHISSITEESHEINEPPNDDVIEKEKGLTAGGNEDRSNAHNFVNIQSVVNPRTGTFSFSLTIGFLNTHSRRFELKLMYSQSAALAASNPFGLGRGWYLNIPFIQRTGGPHISGTMIQMGDGSGYTIEHVGTRPMGELPLRYYDTDDIRVEGFGDDYLVTYEGDQYYIGFADGILQNLTTREGFVLRFSSHLSPPGEHFIIYNETDTIFNMSSIPHGHGKILQCYTSYGIIKYETRGGYLNEIICHSCTGPHKSYKIEYERYPSGLINQITYPSGLVEKLDYIRLGGPYPGKASAVERVTKFPGGNEKVIDKKARAEIQVVRYDYNPRGDHHDFLGTPVVPYNTYKDSLLEYNGFYEYSTLVLTCNETKCETCSELVYDKMHRLVSQTTRKCNTTEKLKQRLHRYGCFNYVNLTYTEMKDQCLNDIKHYTFPDRITDINFGSQNDNYAEITFNKYNNFGDNIFTKKPNGQVESILYDFVGKGKLRLPHTIYNKPREGSPYKEHVTEYKYKQIPCLNDNNKKYNVLESKTESYTVDGYETIYRKLTLSYHTEANKYEYGRIKTEILTGGEEYKNKLTHSYEYIFKNGLLETKETIFPSGSTKQLQSSNTIDTTTGLTMETKIKDETTVKYDYNLEGLLVNEEIHSNDNTGNILPIKRIQYHTEPNNNFQCIKYSGTQGKRETLRFDNGGNLLQSNLLNRTDNKPIMITTFTYDRKWRKTNERQHYGSKEKPKILETKHTYDAFDRLVETETPNRVTEVNEFHPTSFGELIINYLKERKNDDISSKTCELRQFGNIIRRGLLSANKYSKIDPCSNRDSKWFEILVYDGFNRLEGNIKWAHSSQTALEEHRYDQIGNLHIKSFFDITTNKTLLNKYYYYNTMFNILTKIEVKDEMGTLKKIAEKTLDGFGRNTKISYEATDTHYVYNDKNQLIARYFGKKEDNILISYYYDIFGRKNESVGCTGEEKKGKKHVEWTFYDDGKIKSVKIIFGTKEKNTEQIHTKIYKYDISLGKINNFEVSTKLNNELVQKSNHLTYDSLGRIKTQNDFFEYLIRYKYNDKGQLKYATYEKDDEQYKYIMAFDNFARISYYTIFDMVNKFGYRTNLSYNFFNRVVYNKFERVFNENNMENKQVGSIHYTYDDFGQLISKLMTGENSVDDTIRSTFGYDILGRIVRYDCKENNDQRTVPYAQRWKCPSFTSSKENTYVKVQKYSYDIYNNIKTMSAGSNKGEYEEKEYKYYIDDPMILEKVKIQSTSANNEGSFKRSARDEHFIYDSRGNVAKIRSNFGNNYEFQYDGMNVAYHTKSEHLKIIRHHDEAGNIVFHLAENIATNKKKLKYFFYDSENKLRYITDNKNAYGSYLYVGSRRIAFLKQKNLDYYCLDIAGSVMASLNKSESIETFSYRPFGCSSRRNISAIPTGFQNMYTDEDKIIVAQNGRIYASWLGRFLQKDPLSPFGKSGIDAYSFAQNSPVTSGDPTGEFWQNLISTFRNFWQRLTGRGLRGPAEQAGGGYPSISTATSRSLVLPAREITHEDIGSRGGTCSHQAILATAKRYDPERMINVDKLATFGDRSDAGDSFTLTDKQLKVAYKKFGARTLKFAHELGMYNTVYNIPFFTHPYLGEFREVRFAEKHGLDVPYSEDINSHLQRINAPAAIGVFKSFQHLYDPTPEQIMGEGHAVLLGSSPTGLRIDYDTMELHNVDLLYASEANIYAPTSYGAEEYGFIPLVPRKLGPQGLI